VLRAERKSPQTIKVYRDGLHRYLTWRSLHTAEPMNRTSLNRFVAGLLDAGRAAGTARVRQLAVRRFTAWLIIEGRLPADPFQKVTAPKVDQPVVDPLTDDELRALIRACAAPHGTGPHEHRLAHASDLWLGERGRSFGYDGLSRALRRRAQRAGLEGFLPHKLRHTAAHRWLARGGSESGLMAMAGWTRTDMLVRYTKARAMERAAHEARRLSLGEL